MKDALPNVLPGPLGVPTDLGASVSGHVVEYYEAVENLVSRVASYVGAGLIAGEGAVVIATPEHTVLITSALQAQGIDVSDAYSVGTLVTLDAATTLESFMVNGRPDALAFKASVGNVITQVRQKSQVPIVRAFGEMVALLWADEHPLAALALEDLWNELLGQHPFSLLCGYPLDGLRYEDVNSISARHTRG